MKATYNLYDNYLTLFNFVIKIAYT